MFFHLLGLHDNQLLCLEAFDDLKVKVFWPMHACDFSFLFFYLFIYFEMIDSWFFGLKTPLQTPKEFYLCDFLF